MSTEGLIPTRALTAILKRMSGPTLQIGLGQSTVTLTAGTTTTTLQLLDAQFPRTTQLLPTAEASTLTVTVGRAQLRRAVVKAAAMGAAKNEDNQVHLTIGEHGITVAPAAAGSSGPMVAAAVTGEGFPCAFNPYFLADALDTFDTETVTVHFTKAVRPAVLTATASDLEDHTTFKHNTVQLGLHRCSFLPCLVLDGRSRSRIVACRTWSRSVS